MSERQQVESDHGRGGKYLTFEMMGTAYGVDISSVKEIIHLMALTRVPRADPHVRGVMNLRGKIVPVLDLRRILGMPSQRDCPESRIVVMETQSADIGFVVDCVSEVLTIADEQIGDAPEFGVRVDIECIQGAGKLDGRVIILLDLNRALESSGASLVNN